MFYFVQKAKIILSKHWKTPFLLPDLTKKMRYITYEIQ